MQSPLNLPYKIILGSQSPRRKSLLEGLGIPFDVHVIPTKEEFNEEWGPAKIATALAMEKGNCFHDMLKTDPSLLIITADTIVSIEDKILNKPVDREDAFRMIKMLNGNDHTVFTGVAITTNNNQEAFVSATHVYFNELSDEEIYYYIDTCKPYDKAGSYGVQEWIGYVGIRSIEGDFFNVMGLPLNTLYEKLKKYSK
jgi:septum formation protein